jgi:hypothetical protein
MPNTIVLAIDPGYEISAWVRFDGRRVLGHAIEPNAALEERLLTLPEGDVAAVVLEQIESYGMAVGREVFETVFWTGRFFAASAGLGRVERMPRKVVKLHLCQSARAQDSNIRVALLDRFGGPAVAIGKKKTPGPLFGIKSHLWAALALAVVWSEQQFSARKVG